MRWNRLLVKTLAVVVVLLLAAPAFSADKVLLRCKYKPGDKYLACMASDQDTVQERANQTNKGKQSIRIEIAMEVLSVNEQGLADMKYTYRRIAVRQDSPYYQVDYDSADPEKKKTSHPALIGFKGLVGRSITVKITDRGEVKGVKGVEDIMKGILAEVPEGPDREKAQKQLSQTMNEERFSQQLSGLSMLLPENPVGVGDTWDREQKMSMGFANMVMRTNYKVKDVSAATVDLALESKIEIGSDPAQPAPFTISLEEGKQSGTTKLDRANAILTSGELVQAMKMSITVQEQTTKQKINGITTISVKPE